jgi:hypothetical protein
MEYLEMHFYLLQFQVVGFPFLPEKNFDLLWRQKGLEY